MSPRPDPRPDARSDRGPRRPGGVPANRPGSRPSRFAPSRRRDGPEGGPYGRSRGEAPGGAPRGPEGRSDRPADPRAPFPRRSDDRRRFAADRRPFESRPFAGRRPDRFDSPRRGADRREPDRPEHDRREGERGDLQRPDVARRGLDRRPGLERRGGARGARPAFAERRPFQPPAPPAGRRDGAVEAGGGDAEVHGAAAPSDLIWGRHAALAALESGRPVHRIWCTPEMRFSSRFLQLLREAKASGVLVEEVTWARLGQITGGAVHQGIVLQPAAADTLDLPSLIDGCRGLGETPLLIAVDGLTDPQNLGAIVRSAEALGAHGMVLPQRRNAGLTGSVAKVAAGALEHLPVARVVNLNRALDSLKQEGYRVIGLAGEGDVSLEEVDLEGPLVLVTGSEGDGLSMLTRRTCDALVRIPLRGATPSLNASVATALLLYEVARRSWMRGLHGSAPAPRLVRPSLPTLPAAATPTAFPEPDAITEESLIPETLVPEPLTTVPPTPESQLPESPLPESQSPPPPQALPVLPEPTLDLTAEPASQIAAAEAENGPRQGSAPTADPRQEEARPAPDAAAATAPAAAAPAAAAPDPAPALTLEGFPPASFDADIRL